MIVKKLGKNIHGNKSGGFLVVMDSEYRWKCRIERM